MRGAVRVSLPLVLALVLAPAAFGKGGAHGVGLGAKIRGPGLDEPIVLGGSEPRGAALAARIADTSGFAPAVYGAVQRAPGMTSDPMLRTPPKGELGPRYTITYLVPAPNRKARVVQHVYPFAKLEAAPTIAPGQILTYTPPGQRLGDERTRGGWYVATAFLKEGLVAAGLPRSAPTGGDPLLPPAGLAALAGCVLALACAPILIRRRQARPVTT